MSEINSKTNLEYDFDLDIVKKEIKLEPYLDDIKSEFGNDTLYNTEQKRDPNETNTNISHNFGRNRREETASVNNGAHEVDKIQVETIDTVNPFDENLDIVKEEIKFEPYLDDIKSEFGDDTLYNAEQQHDASETNTNISHNSGRNRREETASVNNGAHEVDKIQVETIDTVNPFDENLDIVKEEIKFEPYLDDIKSEFGDDTLYNAEQQHDASETNTNISHNSGRNRREETASVNNGAHEVDKIQVETIDTVNPFDENLDIVKEEIKFEPYLDDIKSEFGDDTLYNAEQQHDASETNTNISHNSGRNRREETASVNNGAHEVDKMQVETTDTVNPFDENLDIVKEEIKFEPYLNDIKSEFCDDTLYNAKQQHDASETNTNISHNSGRNTREETASVNNGAHEVDKIQVETTDTVNPFDEDDQNKNKGKSFTCDVCQFRATCRSKFQTHKNMHFIKKPFICNVCDYRTTFKSNFERHLYIHTGEKPFASNLCEYKSATKGKLKLHLMSTHTRNKPFACNLCEYRSVTKHSLKLHMSTHTGDKPFVCNLCEYRSVTKSKLKQHMSTHTGDKPFACNLCEYRSVRKFDLKLHMSNHTGEKPFTCNLCEYKSVTKRNLKKHMSIHTGDKPFTCNLCQYRSVTKHGLKLHMSTHTGDKPFACNLCEYKSATKGKLKLHLMSTHTGNKPFACNLCEYRTITKSKLKQHMSTHTGDKPFACNLCEYRSVRTFDLKLHMSTHTGEKPFTCNLCECKSVTKRNLKKHMSIHTGDKPFTCNLCQYRSVTKHGLKLHMSTHTGDKPFVCNLCEYRSVTKSKLNGHMSTHTDTNLKE